MISECKDMRDLILGVELFDGTQEAVELCPR